MVKTCGVFIINKDYRLLVGHITNGGVNSWTIPKGIPDPCEMYKKAAIREVSEETGIDLTGAMLHILPHERYKSKNKTLVPFVFFEEENLDIDLNSFDIKCTSMVPHEDGDFPEIDDFKWITLDEAAHCLHESQVNCLTQIMEWLTNKLIPEMSKVNKEITKVDKDLSKAEVVYYPTIGGVYKHYKGGMYEVITLANHTETSEPMVIYKSLLFGGVYARPLSMWFDEIKINSYKKVDRFTKTA